MEKKRWLDEVEIDGKKLTEDEKNVCRFIRKRWNEDIGGMENWLWDHDFSTIKEELLRDHLITRKEESETILNELLKTKGYVRYDNFGHAIDAKHIRFIGKDRLRKIIDTRIEFCLKKDGCQYNIENGLPYNC